MIRRALLREQSKLADQHFRTFGVPPSVGLDILGRTLAGMMGTNTPVFGTPHAAAQWYHPGARKQNHSDWWSTPYGECFIVSEVGFMQGNTWVSHGYIAQSIS